MTEAGQLFKERAGQILELLHTTAIELKEVHEGYRGILAIGTIASSGVPSLVRDFHRSYPKVKFQLWEGDTYRILELLNNGVIEVGIARAVFNIEDYNWVDLPSEPMIVAMAKDSWLALITGGRLLSMNWRASPSYSIAVM